MWKSENDLRMNQNNELTVFAHYFIKSSSLHFTFIQHNSFDFRGLNRINYIFVLKNELKLHIYERMNVILKIAHSDQVTYNKNDQTLIYDSQKKLESNQIK